GSLRFTTTMPPATSTEWASVQPCSTLPLTQATSSHSVNRGSGPGRRAPRPAPLASPVPAHRLHSRFLAQALSRPPLCSSTTCVYLFAVHQYSQPHLYF